MSTNPPKDYADEDIDRQLRTIRQEVTADPLLSAPEELTVTSQIAREFANDETFHNQVLQLFLGNKSKAKSAADLYRSIRYARRDGNCFYRCASFRLYELMVGNPDYARFCLARVGSVKITMLDLFGEYSADFCEVVEELIADIISGKVQTTEDIYRAATSDGSSYAIVFFRYAISVYLREHQNDFLPFVMGMDFPSVESYCTAEVEPVDHESDNIQLVAFAKLFNTVMVVETLDHTAAGKRTQHRMNEDRSEDAGGDAARSGTVFLLFRPGHYDLLEK